jgi:NodT family efflux transporter outer membrane factor (OMF) lipoprotein
LAQRGTFLPLLSADVSASRQQDPSATLSPTPANDALLYGLITPQLDIAYEPDLFGLHRRTRESLKAQEQAVRFQMLAAWTSLTTNVVVTAVDRASLHAQRNATRQLVKLEQQSLDILKLRLQKGDASGLDVSAQQAQLAQSVLAAQALDKQLAVTQHRLDVLLGAFPDHRPEQEFSLADLQLPTSVPVSLPTTLVAQRPDVRQARADLHAASAAIGIAAAERLPNITLTANVGSSALKISKVFTSGTGFWGIAASLTAPIFEAGRLAHHERAEKAAYVAAAQQYRSTVLRAFENVADTLAALERDAESLKAAATAAQAAKTTLYLSQLKLQHGAIGTFDLLVAERTFQQAKIGLAQAKADRFSDTAALYQALGGGWWHHVGLARQ